MMPNFNRLTRTYWSMWKEFHGLYLLVGRSDDVYLHRHKSDRLAPLISKLAGFAVLGNIPESLGNLQVEILDDDFALGFYRYPTMWRVTWTGNTGLGSITLTLSYRKSMTNWMIGGFSMGIVTGELNYDGKSWRFMA